MEQYNINGTTKSIQERIEDLETACEDALEQSDDVKEETSNKIFFGRIYIGAIEDFKKALKTIEDIKVHLTMLDPTDLDYEKAFNAILEFYEKGNTIKNKIFENTQIVKMDKALCNRIIILLEHTFVPHDELPKNLIEFLNK